MNSIIPSIIIEGANGAREVSIETDLLMQRKIFITGKIDANKANDFLSKLLFLKSTNPEDLITIYINSPGGEVNAGLMIYDLIQSCQSPLEIICTGIAASMAALLVAGGQKGRRYILKHSKMMIHEPLISSGIGGSATSIKNISDSILDTRRITNSILAKHTGKSLKEIDKATSFDNYFAADEAVKFGLCDSIIENIFHKGGENEII